MFLPVDSTELCALIVQVAAINYIAQLTISSRNGSRVSSRKGNRNGTWLELPLFEFNTDMLVSFCLMPSSFGYTANAYERPEQL
jgi:hypothetical protein